MKPTAYFSCKIFAIFVLILILVNMACASQGQYEPAAPEAAVESTNSALVVTQPVVAPTFQPTQVFVPTSQPTQVFLAPSIPETRRLTLEFPSKMRAGVEGDVIRLTLEVDELGNITPTAQIEGNVVVGEKIEIPDLYDTHNVTAEARLDLAGMQVQPAEAIYEPLKRGQSATFIWSIRPQDPGIHRGTVWLHVNFVEKSTGEQSRIAISAQIIEIQAVDFFGLSVNIARTSGVIGSVLGSVIGFPFIEDILRFVFRRRKKK
jgi:hypothetical protein